MRVAHLADLHIGFRQFDAMAPSGINQREQDVADTLSRTIDAVIAESPDLVVIAGDVFHYSHPSNAATVHAFNAFARLRKALPHAEVVMVAGNHDAPRTSDAGCMLQLFRSLRIHVVERAAETIELPALDCEILAVPDVVGIERPTLRPSTTRRHRVLLLHGEIAGMVPVRTPHDIDVAALHSDAWSVVCLGHWHVAREVAPGAWYSGSIDYTSSNPWGELAEQHERGVQGKGFLVHDFVDGLPDGYARVTRFVPVPASRPYLDLGPIWCGELTAAEIDQAIAREVETTFGRLAGAVARVVLLNCERHRLRELDQDALRGYRAEALSFQVVAKPPEAVASLVSVDQAKHTSLEDLLRRAIAERPLSPDIDRDALSGLGARFLAAARQTATPVAVEA